MDKVEYLYVESKRRWEIIFETRSIENIREDYLNYKWISKEELIRLKEWETEQFILEYTTLKNQYVDVLNYFNLNTLSHYQLLERKVQGSLKKS